MPEQPHNTKLDYDADAAFAYDWDAHNWDPLKPVPFLERQEIALTQASILMRDGDLALAKGYLDVALEELHEELARTEGDPSATPNGGMAPARKRSFRWPRWLRRQTKPAYPS